MGAEHGHRTIGHFIELFDESRPFAFQRLDDMAVMNDLVAHIDRLAELLERAFNDVDGTHDTGAKTPRLSKNNAHSSDPMAAPF